MQRFPSHIRGLQDLSLTAEKRFLNPFTPIYSMTLNLEPSVGCCQTGVAWHEPGPFFASHLYSLLIGVAFIVVLSFLFW